MGPIYSSYKESIVWGLQGPRQGPLRNAQVQNIFKIARDSPVDTARNFENILNLCISLGEGPYNLIHDDL